MRPVHAATLSVLLGLPLASCTLFADFGGFTEDTPASTPDAEPGDASTSIDASPDAPPTADGGLDGSAYKRAVLEDRPVGYWPFDEKAGANVARDIVGGKDAEVIGLVTFGAAGVDGTAIERAAGGGHLTVGDAFDLAGKQAYTIELWGWPKGSDKFEDVLAKRNGSGTGWIVYFRNDDGSTSVQIEHNYSTGGRTTFAPVPSAKTRLHHVVFVFDPTEPVDTRQRVYVDAVRTNGFSDDGLAEDNTTPLTFVDSFEGILDELAIYDHALSAIRVAAHYELGPK